LKGKESISAKAAVDEGKSKAEEITE